jgi:2-keto-4-pentenoate hydratase
VNKKYGPVIGYKAGLTITAVQKKFGVSHPPGSTLLEIMELQLMQNLTFSLLSGKITLKNKKLHQSMKMPNSE